MCQQIDRRADRQTVIQTNTYTDRQPDAYRETDSREPNGSPLRIIVCPSLISYRLQAAMTPVARITVAEAAASDAYDDDDEARAMPASTAAARLSGDEI